MKKLLGILVLVLLFSFYISVQAQDSPKNYLKEKFYSSVKDNFLIATKKMKDDRFEKTVVAMIENDENGAWGLIINKPLGLIPLSILVDPKLSTSEKRKELSEVNILVFWGGPVETKKIFIVHSNEYQSETTKNYGAISISNDYNILFDITEKRGPEKSLVVLGYSGWGSGQLEGEMEKDHWILSDLNPDVIFEMDNAEKWINAIKNSFIRL
jgi:putative transcriptional regulator